MDRRTALGIVTYPCLGFAHGIVSCYTQDEPELVAQQLSNDGGNPQVIANSSVGWEITPTLDVAIVCDGTVRSLMNNIDMNGVVTTCLRFLNSDKQFVVGHVVLCDLFDLSHPCVTFAGNRAKIRLRGLDVEIAFSRKQALQKTLVYPRILEQHEYIDRLWNDLRGRVTPAHFKKLHSAVHATPRSYPGVVKSTPIPEADLISLVEQTLSSGSTWKPVRLGDFAPVFSEVLMNALYSQRRASAIQCLKHLMQDNEWVQSHLLLAQLMDTDTTYCVTSRHDGMDAHIDGLSIQIDVLRKDDEPRITYPLAENEKHAIRHKWLMRAKDEAWEK
jgi:hypothetical protein